MKKLDYYTTQGPNLFPEDTRRMPVSTDPEGPLNWPEFIQRTRRIHNIMLERKKPKGRYARGLDLKPEDCA